MRNTSRNLTGLFAGRYMIERELGHGASAVVYLARDTRQDRSIALKVLDRELAYSLGPARFLQEIRITARLQHPHILPIHDSGEWNEHLFYVLPFVAGESLRARLEREKQLPIEECVRLTCDIADALAHAHHKGVVHRDVKPENILLSDGHALIADFGIARAIDAHTGERLTSSGLIVGTSSYMSPEQAAGELDTDARSDIYSLGCVLYEMLAGVQPFVGPNTQAVIAQRFTHSPRDVRIFRPTVPDHLEAALSKSLAIARADRFATMKEFAAALPAVATTGGERRRSGRPLRDFVRGRPYHAGAAAAFLIAIVTLGLIAPRPLGLPSLIGSSPRVDSSLYVVLPFTNSAGRSLADKDVAAQRVYLALQKWDSLRLVPDLSVDEAVANRGATSLKDAFSIATSLGAGRLVWGRAGASGSARAQLYDVSQGTRISEVELGTSSEDVTRAVAQLLRVPDRPAAADGGDGLTKSFPAWQAYGRGHAFLRRWELGSAAQAFTQASQADREFAPARLWLAQVRAWQSQSDSMASWAAAASLAASKVGQMSRRDALLAQGLNFLGSNDLPGACGAYRELIALDSMDFAGWHGLGECLSRDRLVFPSAKSSSGWQFRSSYREAFAAFARAVQLDPGAHAIVSFERLQLLRPISPVRFRGGFDSAGNLICGAFPSIANDTLAFLPFPLKEFASLPVATNRTWNAALERNTRDLLGFTRSWTAAMPDNADAFEALATLLEAKGEIGAARGSPMAASGAVARALALSGDSRQRVRLIASEVRLRVKRSDFAAAGSLADSVLKKPEGGADQDLMSLAAMTGRIGLMAQYGSRGGRWLPVSPVWASAVSPTLIATAADIFSRAALGDCSTGLSRAEALLARQAESYLAADQRAEVVSVLTMRTHGMLVPCSNGKSILRIRDPRDRLSRMQHAYARGDLRSVKAIMDTLARTRTSSRPGDLTLDHTFQEAWIKASIGDTAGAAKQLDLSLDALRTLSAASLQEPAAAAALGRAMAMRADLADKTRDSTRALMWAGGVVALWRNADPELQPIVARMKAIASRR